ncbi:hypothetical protein B5M44_19085 [Shinella sumterensis]|uniref:hypothetical protein n=1 Tax=Shinella sumterensis TaxID=1967501 RepID=UPI001101841A|nr:hypothetical protein [Shinella sumterensis]TFE96688.1 hypothetical protein B5M44_19085 [Shinella sumterensis]
MVTRKQLEEMEKRRRQRQAEAAEDAADVAIYDARKAELKNTKLLSPEASMAILRGQVHS